jgi:hypothetical protein
LVTSARQVDRGLEGVASPAEYVFIVGLSRSGTTLLRNVFNRHPRVAIAPENHYLGHLLASEGLRQQLRRMGDPSEDATVERIVEFLYGPGLHDASRLRDPSRLWIWLRRTIPREVFLRRLLDGERGERGVFRAVLDAYAEKKGKQIGGEKTPAHLRYVPELIAWFPGARIIHMLRDPRAIYTSEVRRRRDAPGGVPYRIARAIPGALTIWMLVETTLVWAEGARRARRYGRQFPRQYRLVRFEDLVREPERIVAELAAYVGVEYDAAMLEQTVVSRGARLGEVGIDAAAADRWRGSIPGWIDRWFRVVFRRELVRHGYLPDSV